MAQALPDYDAPLFCLGGTIYPVPPQFDWQHSEDVLLDAIRETRVAMTAHRWASHTPDRLWLDCDCIDPLDHEKYLAHGLFALTNTLLALMPDAPADPKRAFRIPFMAPVVRSINVLAIVAAGSLAAFAATANRTANAAAHTIAEAGTLAAILPF